MQRFLVRFLVFSSLFLMGCLLLLFLPPNQKIRSTNLFAFPQKNKQLVETKPPRIVFLGGSNLSFGLDSRLIQDSLGVHPINNGIHAGIGLNYMMENYLRLGKTGDIVVLIPEYQQFYDDMAGGNINLLSLLVDAVEDKSLSDYLHIVRLNAYIPKYIFSKLKFQNQVSNQEMANDIVGIGSFNEFGDAVVHWNLPKPERIEPYSITGEFNEQTLQQVVNFGKELQKKKIQLFVSFPCYQDSSFDADQKQIHFIESKLMQTGIPVLGTAARYRFNSSFVFNTPYHLTREGVVLRTLRLISDLKKQLSAGNH